MNNSSTDSWHASCIEAKGSAKLAKALRDYEIRAGMTEDQKKGNDHALSCAKCGFIYQRHNELRGTMRNDVTIEPRTNRW